MAMKFNLFFLINNQTLDREKIERKINKWWIDQSIKNVKNRSIECDFFSIFNGQDDDDDDEHNDHANGHSQHWPNDQTDNMISHYVDAKKIIITKKKSPKTSWRWLYLKDLISHKGHIHL